MKSHVPLSNASAFVAALLWFALYARLLWIATGRWWLAVPSALVLGFACLFIAVAATTFLEPKLPIKLMYANERLTMLPLLACRSIVEACMSTAALQWLILSPIGFAVEVALLVLMIPWLLMFMATIGFALSLGRS